MPGVANTPKALPDWDFFCERDVIGIPGITRCAGQCSKCRAEVAQANVSHDLPGWMENDNA